MAFFFKTRTVKYKIQGFPGSVGSLMILSAYLGSCPQTEPEVRLWMPAPVSSTVHLNQVDNVLCKLLFEYIVYIKQKYIQCMKITTAIIP